MKFFFTVILLTAFVLAQAETCESLLGSLETTFDKATQVIMTTQIMQGKREFAYSKVRLYKDEAGEWQSEELEQRGMRRPEDSEGREDGAEPTFDFICEGHTLTQTESGWDLVLSPDDPESPVKTWYVSFTKHAAEIVPSSVTGNFEARVLFIPFTGSFNTRFSDWIIPIAPPDPNANR
jgi:hypothetical protein